VFYAQCRLCLWIVFVLFVFAVECFMPNVASVSGLFLFCLSSLLSVDTGDNGHKTLNSEDKQNKNNPETQTTLGIKHSTAKTNKTKTIQRHRRQWA
jgi:hypothetical protein